ncbi:MAG TPA: serine/threonine-protein kinase, partial [Ramlibacter sp.]|nr:serine/threonine-protein kinase [Ramlibacter sp.]
MAVAVPQGDHMAWRSPRSAGHDAMHFDAPPQVPGYKLLRRIGSGRRSVAWLAYDEVRHADVVLKLQPAHASCMQRDQDIAARVQGPHLLQVHGRGHTASWTFLATEHIAGGDLSRHLRAGVSRHEALRLVREAAEALALLHRQQLVHRDVKPANFLLRADGSLVLADFGLVLEAGATDPAGQHGRIVGTPRYVAPEQLQGAAASPAADVYSLGVLLHEMLAGTPPFNGETLAEVLA